jgi:hypothetical protein
MSINLEDNMGTTVPVLEVIVKRHETPLISKLKNKNKELYEVRYNYELQLKYHGAEIKMNCRDMEHVLEQIKRNETFYHPSVKSVTGNGRWSCD